MKCSRVPWVPKCPSSAQVVECLSTQLSFERPSALSARVTKFPRVTDFLECPTALVLPLKCPLGCHPSVQESFECTSMPFYCFSCKKALQHYWKWSKDFKKLFRINVLHKLIVFCFLRNKMCKFYHVLLARCNHSMGFQKLFLNIL